jgi:hypothetical protein
LESIADPAVDADMDELGAEMHEPGDVPGTGGEDNVQCSIGERGEAPEKSAAKPHKEKDGFDGDRVLATFSMKFSPLKRALRFQVYHYQLTMKLCFWTSMLMLTL